MARSVYEIVVTSRGTRTVQRDIRGIGRAASSTRRTLAFLRSALVVLASVQVLRGFVDLIDSFTLMQNRLKLVTNNMRETTTVMNSLFKISRETRTAFEANVELFSRMARATLDLDLTFRELLESTRLTALAIRISGATAQESRNAVIQFAQGLAAGALQGEELRSVAEQLPRLATIIGREFGIAGGKLIAFNKANPGIITTERVMRALREETGILESQFDQLAPSIAEGFTVLQSSLQMFLGGMARATNVSSILADILLKIADNIQLVVGAFAVLGSIIVINLLISQVILLNSALFRLGTGGISILSRLASVFAFLLTPVASLVGAFNLAGRAGMLAFTPVIGSVLLLNKVIFSVLLGSITAFSTVMRGFLTLWVRWGIILATLTTGLKGLALLLRGALLGSVAALTKAFAALAVVVMANPLFFIGAALIGALVGAFFLFREEINEVIDSLGGFSKIFDDIVTGGIAAVQTIIQRWKEFPAAMQDIAIQAANFLVGKIEEMVNEIIRLFELLPFTEDLFGDIGPQDLFTPFTNSAKGAADNILRTFKSNFAEIKADAQEIEPGTGNVFTVPDSGGGINFIKNKFKEFQDFVEQFTLGGIQIDESLLGGKPPGIRNPEQNLMDEDAIKKAARELAQFRRELEQLLSSVSPSIDATLKLGAAMDILSEARERGIDISKEFGITEAEVMKRVEREILGVGNATSVLADKQDMLADALERNVITLKEYRNTMRDLRIEELESENGIGAGAERAFLKMTRSAEDSATATENLLTDAFRSAQDALIEFVKTGKLSFTDLIDTMLSQLLRLASNEAVGEIGGLLGFGKSGGGFFSDLFSGGGGGSGAVIDSGGPFGSGLESSGGGGGLFSGLSDLLSFNNGGSFTVGPGSAVGRTEGIDNRLVAFRARDGERVSVTPDGGAGGQPINVTYNISTPDANSFRKSQGQILTETQRALQRARQRNA